MSGQGLNAKSANAGRSFFDQASLPPLSSAPLSLVYHMTYNDDGTATWERRRRQQLLQDSVGTGSNDDVAAPALPLRSSPRSHIPTTMTIALAQPHVHDDIDNECCRTPWERIQTTTWQPSSTRSSPLLFTRTSPRRPQRLHCHTCMTTTPTSAAGPRGNGIQRRRGNRSPLLLPSLTHPHNNDAGGCTATCARQRHQ